MPRIAIARFARRIDWSFNLLIEAERQAFVRMALLPAGATVAVAETITGAPLDTLDSLVAKQLLIRQGDRLTMLETVREYAAEKLTGDPGADDARLRLANCCSQLAREIAPGLNGAQRVTLLARLDAELPNVFALLSWTLQERHDELLLRLLGSFGDCWWYASRWQDGLPWLNAALDNAPGAPDHARATALLYRARLTDSHVSLPATPRRPGGQPPSLSQL